MTQGTCLKKNFFLQNTVSQLCFIFFLPTLWDQLDNKLTEKLLWIYILKIPFLSIEPLIHKKETRLNTCCVNFTVRMKNLFYGESEVAFPGRASFESLALASLSFLDRLGRGAT